MVEEEEKLQSQASHVEMWSTQELPRQLIVVVAYLVHKVAVLKQLLVGAYLVHKVAVLRQLLVGAYLVQKVAVLRQLQLVVHMVVVLKHLLVGVYLECVLRQLHQAVVVLGAKLVQMAVLQQHLPVMAVYLMHMVTE